MMESHLVEPQGMEATQPLLYLTIQLLGTSTLASWATCHRRNSCSVPSPSVTVLVATKIGCSDIQGKKEPYIQSYTFRFFTPTMGTIFFLLRAIQVSTKVSLERGLINYPFVSTVKWQRGRICSLFHHKGLIFYRQSPKYRESSL